MGNNNLSEITVSEDIGLSEGKEPRTIAEELIVKNRKKIKDMEMKIEFQNLKIENVDEVIEEHEDVGDDKKMKEAQNKKVELVGQKTKYQEMIVVLKRQILNSKELIKAMDEQQEEDDDNLDNNSIERIHQKLLEDHENLESIENQIEKTEYNINEDMNILVPNIATD